MDRDDRRRVEDARTYRHSRAVRWDRYNYRDDAVVHLTICADRGQPFISQRTAQLVCDSVVRCCELRSYRLYGFCLMPDHLHTLLSPAESGDSIDRWLNAFKSFTTNQYMQLGGEPPLWQRSAYDHVCRDGGTAEKVMRYIADNPVRRKLVDDWRDWPWTQVFVEM